MQGQGHCDWPLRDGLSGRELAPSHQTPISASPAAAGVEARPSFAP